MKNLMLGAALALVLSGCGGSGRTLPVGSSAVAKKFSAPLLVKGSDANTIVAASPNGHLVGFGNLTGAPMYWASPTTTPVALPLGTYQSANAMGVNNSGQIVGYAGFSGSFVPLSWSSASANPVALTIPAGQSEAKANSINASGQIAGTASEADTALATYWSSSSAAPQTLTGIGGASGAGLSALKIANTGQIFGASWSTSGAMEWTSPTANAQALALPAGYGDFIGGSNGEFAVNPETGESGGGLDGVAVKPVYWSSPSEAMSNPPAPTGFTDSVVLLGIGPNHQCVGIAGTTGSVGCLWTTPTSPFQDLNTMIPSGSGWKLVSAAIMLDNGQVLGQGIEPNNTPAWYAITPKA